MGISLGAMPPFARDMIHASLAFRVRLLNQTTNNEVIRGIILGFLRLKLNKLMKLLVSEKQTSTATLNDQAKVRLALKFSCRQEMRASRSV